MYTFAPHRTATAPLAPRVATQCTGRTSRALPSICHGCQAIWMKLKCFLPVRPRRLDWGPTRPQYRFEEKRACVVRRSTRMHTRTCTHAHMRARTHTHTHTHTHTRQHPCQHPVSASPPKHTPHTCTHTLGAHFLVLKCNAHAHTCAPLELRMASQRTREVSVDRCDRLRHMLAPCDATVSIWSARASTAPQGPSNALLVAVCPHGGPTGRAGPNDGSTTYLWVGRGCPRCHTSCAAVFVAWHTPAKSGRSRCTTNILSLPFLTELLTVAPQTQGLRGPSRSCTGLSPLAWDCLCVAAPASSAATSKYVTVGCTI